MATDYNKTIGSAEDLRLALADAIVKRRRPAQFTKLTLDYATPQEIPCNSFFERGDFTDTISAFGMNGVSTSASTYRSVGPVSSATASNVRLMAVGRWFS